MTATPAANLLYANALPVATTLGALGVVYGDIGTSPLYALKEAAKAAAHGGPLAHDAVLGVVSLILWALILIVSIKYAMLILRADNRGEGGIVALLALLHARNAAPGTWRAHLLVVGPDRRGPALRRRRDHARDFGAQRHRRPEGRCAALTPVVVPLTIAILVGLFVIQKQGTGFIGRFSALSCSDGLPIIAALGIHGIVKAPAVLAALNPLYAVEFLLHEDFHISFAILGAAFLAVTGGEAMYADMGHFGRVPIRLAWFAVALPALVLNYFGQAGLLITDPTRDRQSVLSTRAGLGALSAGGVCDPRDRHRLAGDHLGRVLADPASRSSSASCRACRSGTPPAMRSARSMCRW